jgi:hypothetical protein
MHRASGKNEGLPSLKVIQSLFPDGNLNCPGASSLQNRLRFVSIRVKSEGRSAQIGTRTKTQNNKCGEKKILGTQKTFSVLETQI